jgi:tetratricopeptide (TPR) repeat protein
MPLRLIEGLRWAAHPQWDERDLRFVERTMVRQENTVSIAGRLRNGLSGVLMAGLAVPVLLVAMQPANVMAQATSTVSGIVKDPAGTPLGKGEVKFTTNANVPAKERKYQYTFPVGPDGTYHATGVAPGDYTVFYFRPENPDKSADFQTLKVKGGEDLKLDFDMSRPEYLKSLSPEDRAALEAAIKKNAATMAENSKIANINNTLKQAHEDEKNGKGDQAVTELTPLTVAKPDEPIIWGALGDAQLSVADAAYNAARAAKTSVADPAIQQKYADAAASYQKAIDLDSKATKPNPANDFVYYLNLGQAFSREGKPDEAGAAYENAAKANPAQAGKAYYNEAAVFLNGSKLPEAAAAADKAIAADPKFAESYYVKASALVQNTTSVTDPKTNTTKFVLPPGCLEAYQEYLELDPTGHHAADVRALLTSLQQPEKNSFKAGKK